MTDSALSYYAARAHEYENVYTKPERQGDLKELHTIVPAYFAGRRVLEIACGTGYWTRRLSKEADRVTACDVVPEVLAIAEANELNAARVTYRPGDAFRLSDVAGSFDAAFAGFWWSHLLHADVARFLSGLHARLPSGSRIMMIDNRYVEGSNWPISRTDTEGNTFQERFLGDGSRYEVLKNFPAASAIAASIESTGGCRISIRELTYYWCLIYETGGEAAGGVS